MPSAQEAKIGQSDIDQLLAQMSEEDPADAAGTAGSGSAGSEEALSDQQKMEQLLAELTGKPKAAPPPAEEPPAPAEPPFSGTLDQSELDRLLGQMAEEQNGPDGPRPLASEAPAAPVVEEDAPQPLAEPDPPGLLSQADLDRMLGQMNTEEIQPEEAPAPATADPVPVAAEPIEPEQAAPAAAEPPVPEPVQTAGGEQAESPEPSQAGSGEPSDVDRLLAQIAEDQAKAAAMEAAQAEAQAKTADPPATGQAVAPQPSQGPDAAADQVPSPPEDAPAEPAPVPVEPFDAPPPAAMAPAPESAPPATAVESTLAGEPGFALGPAPDEESTPRPAPLKESRRKRPAVRQGITIAGICLLVAGLAAGGYWWWRSKGSGPAATPVVAAVQPAEPTPPRVATVAPVPGPAAPATASASRAPRPESIDAELSAVLQKAVTLRKAMLEKHQALTALKTHYQKGIETLKAQLAAEDEALRKLPPAEALKSAKIAFTLQTIARRQAYLNQLEGPLKDLEAGSEKILFAHRQTEMDLLVAPVAKGLEKGLLTRRLDQVLAAQAQVLQNLTVNGGQATEPLEPIWTAVVGAKADKPVAGPVKAPAKGPEPSADQDIGKQICSGSLENKYKITALSEQTAECLARWEGKDLILNSLAVLTPAAARSLARWTGSWLCLNGIGELTPEAAQYLFQWPGTRLSLNGLSVLTPQVSQYIARWPGKQLELIGLGPVHPKVAEDLVAWQKAGGKLFIREKG